MTALILAYQFTVDGPVADGGGADGLSINRQVLVGRGCSRNVRFGSKAVIRPGDSPMSASDPKRTLAQPLSLQAPVQFLLGRIGNHCWQRWFNK